MTDHTPTPGNAPGLPKPKPSILNDLEKLRNDLLLLSLIFQHTDAGQAIQDECAASAIESRLVDMMLQVDDLRAELKVRP